MLSRYFTGIAVGPPAACFTESPASEGWYLAQEVDATILRSSACDYSHESVRRAGMGWGGMGWDGVEWDKMFWNGTDTVSCGKVWAATVHFLSVQFC